MKDKEYAIQRSRDFAFKVLNNDDKKISVEDYILLTISNFLLLKERVVRKDFHTNIIYFNYERNKSYLDMIKMIVDTVENKSDPIKPGQKNSVSFFSVIGNYDNPLDAKYNDPKYDEDKMYILKFHKIRDALCHGGYSIDFDKKIVKILSVQDDYRIVCNVRLEDLELFSIFYNENISSYEKAINAINANRKKYYMHKLNRRGTRKAKRYYKQRILHLDKHPVKPKYISDKFKDTRRYTTYEEIGKIENKDIAEMMSYIKIMLEMINASKFCETRAGKKKYKSLENQVFYISHLLDKAKNKEDYNNVAHLTRELTKSIEEVISVNGTKIAATFNYLQTFLSNKISVVTGIKDPKNLSALASIKLSRLNYSYKNSDPYNARVNNIVKAVQETTNNINALIDEYRNKHHFGSINHANQILFSAFYHNILRLIGESNQFIIAAIRNGIDHNGINKRNNQMTIRDTNVVFTPNKTSVFKCAAEPEVYFDIVDEVNAIINPTNPALSKPEMLSFDETLEELGYILSSANRKDVFIKFMKAYKNVININMSLMNNGQELKYSSNINRTRQ